jgi:hypothetical protein
MKPLHITPICELCEATPAEETEFFDGDRLIARTRLCDNCREHDNIIEAIEEHRSYWF